MDLTAMQVVDLITYGLVAAVATGTAVALAYKFREWSGSA